MPIVIGLDVSLTGTGIADITIDATNDTHITTHTVTSSGRKGATLTDRISRIRKLRNAICDRIVIADLIVVEAPAFASSTGQVWDRAGLWHHVMAVVDTRGIPYVEVAPQKPKKFATGKGNADKTAVAAGITKLWGDRANPGNDNEFDALTLATMGAIHACGRALPITILERHREVVAGIEWPALK